MKRTFLSIVSAAAVCAVMLSSCKKDPAVGGNPGGGETPGPEPEEVTVSLKLAQGSSSAFDLAHGEDGVIGDVSFSFAAELTSAAEEDVTVSFEVSCDAISTSKINMSKNSVTIPAGETSSETVSVSVSDWSELESAVEAKTFSISVSIGSFEGADKKGSGVYVTVNKKAFTVAPKIHIGTEQEVVGSLNQNVAEWDFEFWTTGGAEIENVDANTFNGRGGSDMAVNNDLINFIVDFKAAKNVTGLWILHWGNDYRAKSFKLAYSNDKESWTELGALDVNNSVYYVIFDVDVNARYLKYEMLDATDRVDLKQMAIYEK